MECCLVIIAQHLGICPSIAGYKTCYILWERSGSSEVKKVPRAQPKALSKLHKNLAFSKEYNGSCIPPHGDVSNYKLYHA